MSISDRVAKRNDWFKNSSNEVVKEGGFYESVFMNRYFGVIVLLLAINQSPAVYAAAASDAHHVEEVKLLADKLELRFEDGKPILPQVLTMRDEMHRRIVKLTRMSSRHSVRCKQARRQLLTVNSLIRHLRNEQT